MCFNYERKYIFPDFLPISYQKHNTVVPGSDWIITWNNTCSAVFSSVQAVMVCFGFTWQQAKEDP